MAYQQQNQPSEFKSTIEWDKKTKLCKVEKRVGKTGREFFYGEFNKMFKIILDRNDYAKDKEEWNVSLVPVSYKKEGQQEGNGYAQRKPAAQLVHADEPVDGVPF